MTSDPGEYIGQGQDWHHGSAYGQQVSIEVFEAGDMIQFTTFRDDGGAGWSAGFSSGTGAPLAPGTYATTGQPGSPWFGLGGYGRGCGRFTGSFTISELAYDPGGALRALRLGFEAHCEALPEALRGDFAFRAA